MRDRTGGGRVRVAGVLLLLAAGCRGGGEPDAYGNFEASEVIVAAQTSGQVLSFALEEGEQVASGAIVAVIDSTQLVLERQQILAQRQAAGARVGEASAQEDALRVQREVAQRNYERTRRLFAQQAATAQQLDQAEREYRVLGEQIAAAQAQRRTVGEDTRASEARLAQIRDRIAKSRVANPLAGTVLATYAERGEFVQPGQPLYKVASLDTLVLRAYMDEPQLARLKLGQQVVVRVDRGGARLALPGIVSWIASKAEFTPTPVQTRDERASLVYAVKIRVPNRDGALKIGMPADVQLTPPTFTPADVESRT